MTNAERLHSLTQLMSEVADLRKQVNQQQVRIIELEKSLSNKDTKLKIPAHYTSRRRLLKYLGLVILTSGTSITGSQFLKPKEVQAKVVSDVGSIVVRPNATVSGSLSVGANYGLIVSSEDILDLNSMPNDNTGIYGIGKNGIVGKSTGGIGVQGYSTNSQGVYGKSISNTGVFGTSITGSGVHGRSISSYGVHAQSIVGSQLYLDATHGQTYPPAGTCNLGEVWVDGTGQPSIYSEYGRSASPAWHKLQLSGSLVNVFDFGVIADGKATKDAKDKNTALIQMAAKCAETQKAALFFPAGEYTITAPITLPITGLVYGEGPSITRIKVEGDINGFEVAGGTGRLYLRDIGIFNDGTMMNPHAAIKLRNHEGQIQDFIIENIVIENTYFGIDSVQSSSGILGFEAIGVHVACRGSACVLRNSTACKLRYFISDHSNERFHNQEKKDIWLEGMGAGGGAYLDHVVAQYPGNNGIIIENFSQLWARHATGDEAHERGIWIIDCKQIHLHQCFASLAGESEIKGVNSKVGYSMVIENTKLPYERYNNHTIDQCHAGGAQVQGGMLIKNCGFVSVTNGTYIENHGFGIKLENCENIAISGALLSSEYADDGILLENSKYCNIVGNNIEYKQYSIRELGSSDYNLITGNVCRSRSGRQNFIKPASNTMLAANVER